MYSFLPIAYHQKQFIPFFEAKISIATHAFHYGTGAFGGLRGIQDPQNPRQILLFRFDQHCQRLSNSAKLLDYDLPAEHIREIIIEFIQQNQPNTSIYIRPFIYTSDLGLTPRVHNIEKDFLIYGLEMGDSPLSGGVSCRISSWSRQQDASLPLRGKISGTYITSALAKTEAAKSGFDEAILLNSQGKVSEATAMNVFIVRNGQLITPGVEQDILEGITRNSILTIARDLGIPVIERPVDKSELLIADEAFLSGTAARLIPIKRIESYMLSEFHPITDRLRGHLFAIMENRLSQYPDLSRYENWVQTVSLDSLSRCPPLN